MNGGNRPSVCIIPTGRADCTTEIMIRPPPFRAVLNLSLIPWVSFPAGHGGLFRFRWAGMLQGNMKQKEVRIHPTQKPVALYAWIFSKFAHPGEKILDTHLGSGAAATSLAISAPISPSGSSAASTASAETVARSILVSLAQSSVSRENHRRRWI
mgnify:CR=1 FL=1